MNKDRWAITFKKVFAETFNALHTMALDEDCDKSLTCTNVFNGGQKISTLAFGEAMSSVLTTTDNCQITPGDKCFAHKIKVGIASDNEQTIRETLLDKFNFATELYTFRTNRGVSYAVFSFGMKCLNTPNVHNEAYWNAYVYEQDHPENQMLSLCGFIVVDVNGPQRPNTWGRDVFGMWVTDRSVLGVYPFGGNFDNAFRNMCNVNSEETAQDTRGCAAQLIKDGWKMKY